MKSILRLNLFAILLSLAVLGCKHPSAPPSEPATLDMLWGAVAQLDTVRSNFDTSLWLPDSGLDVHLQSLDTVTNIGGFYWFYHLKIQDATLTLAQPGYAGVTVWHAQEENSFPVRPPDYYSGSVFNILLVPNSWLKVTMDNFQPNIDTSIITKRIGVQTDGHGDTTNFGTLVSDTQISTYGIYTIARIHSLRPDKPALGYVTLYLSTQPTIDPADPTTFNLVCPGPSVKDSTVKIVLPQNFGQWNGQNLASGTPLYCTAYAYPFPNLPRYLDASREKSIFYGIGQHPSNTVTVAVP